MKYQGSKDKITDLPTPSESIKGHLYTVIENGHEYVCDGTQWVDLSSDLIKKADKTALDKEILDRTTADTTLQTNIDNETSRATTVEATKVNITESNANGKSQFINENDGGGVFFIKDDNTSKSYIGVNDSTAGGPDAQIYAINPSDDNKGSKIDITKEKVYYTANTTLPYSQRIIEANEIAVKGDISTETTRATTAENTLQENINSKADKTYVDAQDATKQDKLSNSTGIDISNNVIKAVGVEYKNNTTTQSNALKFVKLTQAQYDALTIKDADTLYMIVG